MYNNYIMEIFNNDCLVKLKEIEGKSVDCVICDLPYGTTACKWDNKIDLDDLWRELKRVARNDNTPYFFFCDMRFASQLIVSNPKWFRYDLVWFKRNSGAGYLQSGKMPLRKHEIILVFYKNLPTYNKNKYHNKKDNIETHQSKTSLYGETKYKVCGKGSHYDIPLPISVLEYDIESKRQHTTQKPQPILEWIIKYYSNEGDTILDPTMGSGSTGVAAKTLNRKFIGIEMDEKYYEVAKKRLGL